ncbi:hypothetical protein [Pseudomonas sp. NPDC086278]|uniref:hypothetical protein n=1 Tax=Pseudomonas sp. NPDC086278 TaxID=3390646 RepID=UPI003D049E2D
MQAPTSSTPAPSSPSDAQLYQGQLDDYELMLTAMRDVNLHQLIPIRPFSPLHRLSEDGYTALWQLLRDSDYIALCTNLKLQHFDLCVNFKDGNYVYQAWAIDGGRVSLALTEHEKWQALKTRIEQAATLLGGEIHSNRCISLDRICQFYGLAPWRLHHPQEHPAAITALQEKIASHRLRLEDDFDALDLKRRPTADEREMVQLLQQVFPDTALDVQALHCDRVRGEIIAAIKQFLPEETTSLLTHLANDILSAATNDRVRATPTVYLEKILHSAEAVKLGNVLLSTMGWFGGASGEETSPFIRTRLTANALQYWLSSRSFDNRDLIAGYDWQACSNWGKSYQAIRADFETHLLTSERATSEKEAIVSARLFLSRCPTECRISDIPLELPYRSSIVWVNFINGVNLIKALDSGLLDRLTFQQLVNLPTQLTEGATPEQLNKVALARLLPTLDWAVTQGFLSQGKREHHTQQDIDRAVSELEKQTDELNEAVTRIGEAPPQRLAMAKNEVEQLFGKDAFTADGRRLARTQMGPVTHRDTPFLKGEGYASYSFLDVLACGKFDDQKRWFVTEANGTTLNGQWIRIDEHRTIKTEGPWPLPEKTLLGLPWVMSRHTRLPDVQMLFDTAFKRHLERISAAYETLIRHQLASLPFTDRQALESGEVRVYTLRKQTTLVEGRNETPEMHLPLRARNGVILQATHDFKTTCYELLPRAAVLRRIENPDAKLFGGELKSEEWRVSKNGTYTVKVLRHKTVPFDWDAHLTGTAPKQQTDCQAIIEQLGDTLTAPPKSAQNTHGAPLALSSSRSVAISHHIAKELLFVDPVALRKSAAGQTQFELEEEKTETGLMIIKMLLPFWGSIEDLLSDDKNRHAMGVFGLFTDLLSFALPIGKFVSGSARLITTTTRLSVRTAHPGFTSLTKKLLASTLKALNPLDGIPALLKASGTIVWKNGRLALGTLNGLRGKTGHYRFVQSLPQIGDAGRWKSLAVGDQLARVNGIDNVPVRNLASAGNSDYRLIEPIASKPYGPTLTTKSGECSPGGSHYSAIEKTDQHVIVEIPENTRVNEVLEVDGRTTLFLDEVPYRLDGETLLRADLVDGGGTLKALPCRVRRAPRYPKCKTRYAGHEPAPTPDIGHFDETKGWATWFGDVIYTPATGRAPMRIAALAAHSSLEATLEFQKGIYGRVMVSVPVRGQQTVDNFRVGAILVEAMDGSKTYVFTRLNAGDFLVAERIKGQNVYDTLTFRKAETLDDELRRELQVVYTGSLNANNVARIHGIDAVERAMKTMEEIAIPIGGHVNPPDTLKWINVDTSPGEAVLFDHSTRMIVTRLPEGAKSWSRSKEASTLFRTRTAEIFDTLFLEPTIKPKSADSALRIGATMNKLHKLLPRNRRSYRPRNIAYAEVTTTTGQREVYVSVSGTQETTGHLPLFRHHLGTDTVKVGETTYFNIDFNEASPGTSLKLTPQGKLLAVPHTIKDIAAYSPAMTRAPTSLDSESKLIGVIREKYPDPQSIQSIDVATTMPPCDSCAVVLKEFGYDGGENALSVLWN